MAMPVLEAYFADQNPTNVIYNDCALSGIQAGDLLIAIGLGTQSNLPDNIVSMPGWNLKQHALIQYGGGGAVWWKIAVGGETSAYMDLTISDESLIQVLRISGADPDDPFDQFLHSETWDDRYPTCGAITSTKADTLAFVIYQQNNSATLSSWPNASTGHPPWVYHNRKARVNGSRGDPRGIVSTQAMAAAGSTGTARFDMGTTGYGHEWTFNIQPASNRRIFIT